MTAFRNGGAGVARLTSLDGGPITPDDNNDLPWTTVEIHLGGGGDLEVIYHDQTEVKVLPALTAGRHSLALSRILAANTTATDISVSY